MAGQRKFRMTHWPGDVVRVPPVLAWPLEVEGGYLQITGTGDARYVTLPDQLYLFELADLDLADVEAVASFSRTYGLLRSPLRHAHHDAYDDLPGVGRGEWHRAITRQAKLYGRAYVPTDPGDLRVHIDELTFRARILRQLSAHAQAYQRGDYERDVWPDCDSEADAWRRFTDYANAALRPFHVRVYVDNDDPSNNIGDVHPTLYEASVLQLVNDLQENVEYRRCAADGCGRVFVRQRGYASAFSRSKGVMYCTKQHADAQAQRERRRRIKQSTQKGEDDGR